MMRNRLYIEILKGVIFGISILGFTSGLILKSYPFDIVLSVLLVVVLTSVYFIAVVYGERSLRTHYKVERDSPEETKIFEDWYSQPGELKIFCTDLKWIAGKDEIIGALLQKGDSLHLYLRNRKQPVANQLFQNNATIYQIKKGIKSFHRFSILNDDGFKSVLLRNKQDDKSNQIEIVQFRNHPALYNLGADMLDDCFNKIYHNSTHEKLY